MPIENKQNYSSVYRNLYFGVANWKTKYSALNDSKHPLSSNCSWFLIPNRMNLQISEQVVLLPAVISSAGIRSVPTSKGTSSPAVCIPVGQTLTQGTFNS